MKPYGLKRSDISKRPCCPCCVMTLHRDWSDCRSAWKAAAFRTGAKRARQSANRQIARECAEV